MASHLESLGIDKLSTAERLLLVEEIWDSIAARPETLPIPDSHREELAKRLAAYKANPHAGAPWEEVKARILKKS
jgi:putative addiction module component (TIGR02574 family)